MPSTQIWTLPDSLDDSYPYRLADFTAPAAGRLYYAKAGTGVLGMLDPAARLATEWVMPVDAAPPAAIADGYPIGSASRVALTPGSTPKVWGTLNDWKALGEFDPVNSRLRVFSSSATGPVNQGGAQPFGSPSCVFPESATRIWFGSRSYPDRNPLIGLLDTATGRVAYWTLGGPAAGGKVEDLVLGADGRIWFACSGLADEGEHVAFLGVLETHNRRVRYWTAPGLHHDIVDRTVGARRLGARQRGSAKAIWLALRNALGSTLIRVDTANLAMQQFGTINIAYSEFCIAVPSAREAAVGYRDFFRIYDNLAGCREPVVFASSAASVRVTTRDVLVDEGKTPAVKSKVQTRKVQTALADETCVNTLTPDAPSICDFLHTETGGRLWLGRQLGNEIGLYTP